MVTLKAIIIRIAEENARAAGRRRDLVAPDRERTSSCRRDWPGNSVAEGARA